MSEIEKLYRNAGIPKCGKRQCKDSEYLECQNYCFCNMNNKCDKFIFEYPPFTAEKELKLIKWFIHSRNFCPIRFYVPLLVDNIADKINFLWDVLTEEEKQQIKEILE